MQPLTNITTDPQASSARALKPWILMIWMLALAPVLPIITTPRVFDAHFSNFISGGAGKQGIAQWFLSKLTTYGILATAFILIAKYKKRSKSEWSEEARRLLVVVVLYSLAPILVTLFMSKTRLTLGMLGLPIIFAATYYLPVISPGEIAKHVRAALATLYIYGSILAVIIAPKWAIESGYSTELSYTVFRLYGLAVHANSLAAYLFVFIVLGWMPGARLKMEKLHVLLAVILMVATQSKTVIAIFLIVLFLKFSGSYLRKLYSSKILRIGVPFVLIGFVGMAISWALQSKAVLEKIQNPEVITLTGRLKLWVITFSLWREKPWFGYGADMWNAEMQLDYARLMGGWLAPHAHNQFLQTLGEAGVVGAGLLLIVYYAFGKSSWRLFSFTGGVSFYLFVYLALRSLTEVPIVSTVGQSNFLNFWTIYAILITSIKSKNAITPHS